MDRNQELEVQKKRLPRGWGRFGKSIDALAGLLAPTESLVTTCVGVNPDHNRMPFDLFAAGSSGQGAKQTNVLLALTNRRVIAVATSLLGQPLGNLSIPITGMRIEVDERKRTLRMAGPAGEITVSAIAKNQYSLFTDAVIALVTGGNSGSNVSPQPAQRGR